VWRSNQAGQLGNKDMNKFSISSAEHRDNETLFWSKVDNAKDKYRAQLAMRAALQNASDTPNAEWGFWDCALSTYCDVYDNITDHYPSKYKISHHGGQRRAVRIRE
jgi:hypothetical protein